MGPCSVLRALPVGVGGTLDKGWWGPNGSVGIGTLHTCGPSGCAHVPWGQGTWVGVQLSCNVQGTLSPRKSGHPSEESQG